MYDDVVDCVIHEYDLWPVPGILLSGYEGGWS